MRRALVVVCAAVGFAGTALSADDAFVPEPLLPFAQRLDEPQNTYAADCAFGPDGLLWIAGETEIVDPEGVGTWDVVLLRYDTNARTVVSRTLLGGTADDFAWRIAIDPHGRAYVSGTSFSPEFPRLLGRGARPWHSGFVAQVHADGSGLAWAEDFGVAESTYVFATCFTDDGDLVVAGQTYSSELRTVAPLQPGYGGAGDVFLARLRPDGRTVWCTYLGGRGTEQVEALCLLPGGGILVAGYRSGEWPVEFGRLLGTGADRQGAEGFLVEVDPDGSRIVRAELLGSTRISRLRATHAGGLFAAGTTSDVFPFLPDGASYAYRAYVARLDAESWKPLAGRYLAGSIPASFDVAADGTLWVASALPLHPLTGAIRPLPGGESNHCIAAFDAEFSLLLSSFVSGRSPFGALAAGPDGTAWLAGSTRAREPFSDAELPTLPLNAFVAHVEPGDPAARPDAVGIPLLEAPTGRAVRVSWTSTDPRATGFRVFRTDALADSPHHFPKVVRVPGDAREWVDDSVTQAARYAYAVQATNAAGGSAVSEIAEVVVPEAIALEDVHARLDHAGGRHSRAGRFRMHARLSFRGTSEVPDPRADGLRIAMEPYDRVVLWTSLDDRRWRVAHDGTLVLRDRTTRVTYDATTGALQVRVRRRQLFAALPAVSTSIRLNVGEDSASVSGSWPIGPRGSRDSDE